MVGLLFAVMVFQGWEISTASGQGLFSRWRARIDSRRPVTPNQPQIPSQPRLSPPSQTIQPSGRAATGTNLRSVSPRAPGQGGAVGNSGSGDVPVFGIDVSPARLGAYQGLQVLGFRGDSQAARAGLRPGDMIVSIGGVRTVALNDVALAQSKLQAGQQAEMQVIRGGRIYRVQVPVGVIGSRPNDTNDAIAERADDLDAASPRVAAKPPLSPGGAANGPTLARPRSSLGLEVRNATPKRGIEVVVVRDSSAGKIGGLKPQDRIVSVEGRLVKDIDGLIRELTLSQPGDEVQFGVVRGDSMLELNIEMGGPGGKPIQSATAKRSPTPQADAPTRREDGSNAGPSLLSGMGSALGGFFAGDGQKSGGAMPSELSKPTRRSGPGESDVVSEELMAPAGDPLALPEDEAGFEESSGVDVLPTPQPLPVPEQGSKVGAEKGSEKGSEVERLRAEVKRLRAKLEE